MTSKKADKYLDKNPKFAAKQCAERYPIIEKTDTVKVENKTLLDAYEAEYAMMYSMIDSLINAKCDTVYREKIINVIKRLPAKPETIYIYKTLESTARLDTLRLAAIRREAILTQENADLKADLYKLKDKIANKNKWLLWLWLVVILLSVYSLRRQIFKLIRP